MTDPRDPRDEDGKPIAEIAALGGEARDKKLTKARKAEIARLGGLAKAAKAAGLPTEEYDGTLVIGPYQLACSVLSTGERVFSMRGVNRAFGAKKTGLNKAPEDGAPRLPTFLAAENVKPFISRELSVRLNSPIEYRMKHGGRNALAIPAECLPAICEVIIDAADAGKLRAVQKPLAISAKALHRACARVGITALVDEATGYQAERARDELQRLLEKYVREEMKPWVQLFPNSFFKGIYKIYEWEYVEGSSARPQVVGHFVNKYVYDQLPRVVLDELRRRNPVVEKGRRKHKHHQFLTEDVGIPPLDRHLAVVTTLLTLARDKHEFKELFAKAFPRTWDQTTLAFRPGPQEPESAT